MKLPLLLIALCAVPAAAPVLATAPADPRVRSIPFTPDKVFSFVGKAGYQSTIRFAPDERIENVAVGDSLAWQVTPNKRGNHLFVKPLIRGARSNMTVVTDKRTYLFDLEARQVGQPIYALRFEYPLYPASGSIAPVIEADPAPVVTAAAETPKPAPQLNFSWVSKGAKALFPARTFDDGSSVFLGWPEDAELPAILVASNGAEAPVDYRVEAGHIVVPGVPRELILRRGKHRATVTLASNANTSAGEKSREVR